ncbi:MAG: hypothetical protein HQL30_11590 [Candidatus Omnitrophica bacterium]|nr:hypothetical protein [Candidatus Omnitrophota bacterium]
MNTIIFNKITRVLTALVFCVTAVLSDMALAESVQDVLPNAVIGPGVSGGIDPGAFSLPPNLGLVKDIYCARNEEKAARTRPVVIHIQDAHCNYYAQIKIAEIIRYFRDNHGVNTVNLEGGTGQYDLSVFTEIADKDIRRGVAEHFLKSGVLSGAEYYAATNPEKAFLWGIEDPELYARNLKVYRDAAGREQETEKGLELLERALEGLKSSVYTDKLAEFDRSYARYKSGGIDLKEYAVYLQASSLELGIGTDAFKNIGLLSRVIEAEKAVNFKKADNERGDLLSLLGKKLSKRESRGIAIKTLSFKNGEISQTDFYGYLAEMSRFAGVDVPASFPELGRYIGYITMYAELDRSMVVKEMRDIEDAIRGKLCVNDDQRELGKLSMTFALLKNIFKFTLTREDWGYYKERKEDFSISNFRSFIGKHGALSGIAGSVEIERLDGYRESISEFFEYSFKRDEAFIRNMRFHPEGEHARGKGARDITIMITGGFHAENIWELFRSRGMDYISIMPGFTSPEGYKNPYFDLLSGKKTGFIGELMSALSAMQVASLWNSLGLELDGEFAEFARAAVKAMARISGTKEPFKIRVKPAGKETKEGWVVFSANDGGEPECRFTPADPGPGIKGDATVVSKDPGEITRAIETMSNPDAAVPRAKERPVTEELKMRAKALVNRLTSISDRDERRKSLEELREIGNNALVLETVKKEAGIEFDLSAEPDYRSFGVDEKARSEVEKLPGLGKFLFHRDNLAKLANLMSRFRMVYDYKDSVPNNAPYLKYAWDNGLAYCLTPGAEVELWCSPASGSFRRHIFFVTENGVIKDKLEIKMSGEKPGKENMADVFGGWDIKAEDKDEHVFRPLYSFNSLEAMPYMWNANLQLYNTRRESLGFYLYKYEDGIRIELEGDLFDLSVLGINKEKIKKHLAKEVLKKALFFHLRNGLVGTPVPEIAGIQYLSKAEQEERRELGWLKELIRSNTDMHIENFKVITEDLDILLARTGELSEKEILSKIKVKQVGDLQGFHGQKYTRVRTGAKEEFSDNTFNRMIGEEMWSMLLRLQTVMLRGSARETMKCFIEAVEEMGLEKEARRVYVNLYEQLTDADAKVLAKWAGAAGAARAEDVGPSLIGKVTDDNGKICNRIAGIVTTGGIFKRLSVTMASDSGTKTVHAGIILDRRGAIAARGKEAMKVFLQKAEGQRQYLTEREEKALDSFKRWLNDTNGYGIVPIGGSAIKGLIDHTARTVYLAKNLADDPLALFHEWGELHIRLTVKDKGEQKHISPHTVLRGVGKDLRYAFMAEYGEDTVKGFVHIRNAIEARLISDYAGNPGSISKYRGLRIRSGFSPITEDEVMLMKYNYLQGRRGVRLLGGLQDLLSPGTENDDLTEKAANKKWLAGPVSLMNAVVLPLISLVFMNNGVSAARKAWAFLNMTGVMALSPIISLARVFMPVNVYKKIVYALVLLTLIEVMAHPIHGTYSPSFDPGSQTVTLNLVVEETARIIAGTEVGAMLEDLGKKNDMKVTVDGNIAGEYTENDMEELENRVMNVTDGGKIDPVTGEKVTEVVIGENAAGNDLEIKAIYSDSVKTLLTGSVSSYMKLLNNPEKKASMGEARKALLNETDRLDKGLKGPMDALLRLMPDLETALRNVQRLRQEAGEVNRRLAGTGQGYFIMPFESPDEKGEESLNMLIYAGKYDAGEGSICMKGVRIDDNKFDPGAAGFNIAGSDITLVNMGSCVAEAVDIVKGHEEIGRLRALPDNAAGEDKDIRAYVVARDKVYASEFTDPATGKFRPEDEIAGLISDNHEAHERSHASWAGDGLPETGSGVPAAKELRSFLRQLEKGPNPGYSIVRLVQLTDEVNMRLMPHYEPIRRILSNYANGLGMGETDLDDYGKRAELFGKVAKKVATEDGKNEMRDMARKMESEMFPGGKLPGERPSLIGKVKGKNGIVTHFDISEPAFGVVRFAGDDRVIEVGRSEDQGNYAKEFTERINSAIRGNNYLTEEEKAHVKALSSEIAGMEIVVIQDHDKDGDTLRGGIDRAMRKIYLSDSLARSPLAFLHEFGEGNDLIEGRPAELTNHSALRGAGKDARADFELIKNEEGIFDPEVLIKKLNEKMKRPLTGSEVALIRYNFSMREKPGFKKCFARFGAYSMLMGFQDRLDPYSNMAFSEGLRGMSDDIRGDVMNIVISRLSLFQSAAQENWARKTERKFKKIGVDTLFRGYNDVESLKEAVDAAIIELGKNDDKQPNIYINCLVESAEKPGKEYEEIHAYINGKYPEFMERIVLQKDVSAVGSGVSIDEFNVDVLKVISFGSIMLNDKRLSKFASFDDEALVASRKRLVEFMKKSGMFKGTYFEDVVENTYFLPGRNEAQNYQSFMNGLLKGLIPVRLTPVDINDIAEYNASLEEVYRSL